MWLIINNLMHNLLT